MNMTSLQWLAVAVALAALPVEWASAQPSPPPQQGPQYGRIVRDGYKLGKADAEKLEASLASNPDDLAARTRLLGYYWRGARYEEPETKIAARRRHILWLIEHHPASEPAGLWQAIIVRSGVLGDSDGREQAAKLWLEQAGRHGSDAAVLGNAGSFFLMSDRAQAEALFKQAQRAAPDNPEWSARLGILYAFCVLGLDGVNENFFPLSHSPAEAKGDFARHAREELEKSTDAVMVGAAGTFLSTHGVMLEAMFRGPAVHFTVDYVPLTEALLAKVRQLDPAAEGEFARRLEEFRKHRRDLQQRLRGHEQPK